MTEELKKNKERFQESRVLSLSISTVHYPPRFRGPVPLMKRMIEEKEGDAKDLCKEE